MGPTTLMSLAENAGTAAPKDLMDPQGFIYESELARKSAILARNDNVENGWMISISVAMATFNGQRFIREQLNSLAAQQHLPSELIIADDASSDKTVAIAEQFAKAAPFTVHIHRHDNRVGYRANFMRAASLCTSDVIAFCDQDDIWSPRKLALCIEPFQDPAVLLAYHNAEVVTAAGERVGSLDYLASAPITPPLSLCPIRNMPFALGFTEVFRRSILEFSDLWEMSLDYNDLTAPMGHDQWVFFIASVFGSIVYIDKALASYRQHDSNLYGWNRPLDFFSDVLPYLLYNPTNNLHALQQVSGRCAEILKQTRHNLTDIWQQRATMGAARYRFLADLYAARKRLYTSAILAERVKAFHRIVSTSGYRPKRSWGLGRQALVRDLCLGLPAGHLL
jgi:glycosyltransferase involved in cell wall biosynthesis